MLRLLGTITEVILVSLWRFNLTEGEEFQELPSRLTY
ncbi:hypothetical protein Gotur_034983 [Gossypium turneri]